MLGMVKTLFSAIFACSGSAALPQVRQAPPMPQANQPRQEHGEEWLAMKDSGKSHRFYVVDGLNPYYKYSLCGFETTADKVKVEEEGAMRCKRCLLMKG